MHLAHSACTFVVISELAKLYEIVKSATVAQVETIEFIRWSEVEADLAGGVAQETVER
jgi:hypothetical protein